MNNEKVVITGASLMSLDEYDKCRDSITLLRTTWWLRSLGINCLFETFVDVSRKAQDEMDVDNNSYTIRPILWISSLGGMKIGDKIDFGGKVFTIVSPQHALCDTGIGTRAFRRNYSAEDANLYKTGNVKKLIDKWYKAAVEAKAA